MHLGDAAEFSTFRRTLAAILSSTLGMTSEDDPQLSAWIKAHLRVIAIPVPDADQLGQTEAAVLDRLDPPLNLQGRPPQPGPYPAHRAATSSRQRRCSRSGLAFRIRAEGAFLERG
jgi:hypothetical protein